MKLNSLQIGKAMSAALFVLLLSVAGMKNVIVQNNGLGFNYKVVVKNVNGVFCACE